MTGDTGNSDRYEEDILTAQLYSTFVAIEIVKY